MTIDLKSFKLKIFAIFLVPTIAIVYFTYFYVQFSNANIKAIEQQKANIEQVNRLIDLIHNIQIERGLSAGYLVSKDSQELKEELQTIYENTQETISRVKPSQYTNDVDFQNLSKLRKKVLARVIPFDKVIDSYTKLNNELINNIKYIVPKLDQARYDAMFLINLELLKENAGLERAYIYNELILGAQENKYRDVVTYLQTEQKKKKEDLFLYSNENSISIYKKYVDLYNEKELDYLRKKYHQNTLTKKDALYWFESSSSQINSLNKVSKDILNHFTISLNTKYDNTQRSLNIAIILWIISILSTIYFIYLIHKLFQEHERYTQDLELSSRTLDSYEGVVITDQDTKIIKVNKGFERITGYSFEEAVGKRTSILRSGKNPPSVYKAMWGSINKTGSWSGEVLNRRKDGKIYSQRLSISSVRDKQGNIKNYIGHLFDITELRQAQQEALYQASHDSLTELINRKYLMKRMKEEIARSKRHNFLNAFLFIDLDNFKSVNDNFGHHIGDKLLQYVANVLKTSIRECDLVARISGDEFAIVLLDIDSSTKEPFEVLSSVAQKIIDQLNTDLIIESHNINIGSSIGIRLFPLNEFDNEENVIKDADSAMYEAKNGGKNRFVIFKG